MRHIVWFSCGIASAVAAKLASAALENCEVVYCDTLSSEHPDNLRFLKDVELWIERKITIIRSEKFTDVDDVFRKTKYMSGVRGARCTAELKKLPRVAYQRPEDIHIFGFTSDEARRADDFDERNRSLFTYHLLVDLGVSKSDCIRLISKAGIERPAMYDLGFAHNNCIGCVKSQSAGYWNDIRLHFPDVFERRAAQSRALGVKLVRVRLPGDPPPKPGEKPLRHFLDELPEDARAEHDEIECGPVCQRPDEESS